MISGDYLIKINVAYYPPTLRVFSLSNLPVTKVHGYTNCDVFDLHVNSADLIPICKKIRTDDHFLIFWKFA